MSKVGRYFQVGKAHIPLNRIQLDFRDRVTDKIQQQKYRFEEVPCGFCGADVGEELAGSDRYGLEFHVKVCRDCGGVYTSPRMNQESYNLFYNEEYRPLYVGAATAGSEFFLGQVKHGEEILQIVQQAQPGFNETSKVVWEVGCGAGGILQVFKSNGHRVLGVDLGEEYLEYGKTHYNLDLRSGTLLGLAKLPTPDLIIYSHVMEHILDLNAELLLLNQLEGPQTLLYIEVPGIKNIHKSYGGDIMTYFQNAHVWHFTLTSLRRVFERHGFELVEGDEFVKAVFKKRNETSTAVNLGSEKDSVIGYVMSVERNRWRYRYSPRFVYYKLKTQLKKLVS